MKIALVTDTHFNFKKSNQIYHDYFERFYTDVFFPTLEDRRIDTVIHLGDAFDNRKGVDYWGLDWAQRVFYDRLSDLNINLFQICGNHDSFYKNSNKINAIDTLLRSYKNIYSFSSPGEIKIGNLQCLILPWICAENEDETFSLMEKTKAKVIFGHLELQGFTLFPGKVNTHGLTTERFEKFDRVFTGHYHARSNNGKIFYLGNPYQMFWSDVDDKRGFHIFDTQTYELEFISNPYNLYERFYYEDTDWKTFDYSIFENKNVKIIVKERTSQSNYDKFISKILETNIIDLSIVELIDVNDTNVNFDDIEPEDTFAVLSKYVEEADFSLDKDMIKAILHNTYKEALELEAV
jgi:DNA repair exonuclease SbcCD nuclease subunit